MRFTVGDVTVDVIVDENDFELPLRGFLPGLDFEPLRDERSWLEPDFVDLARNVMRLSIKSFVLRLGGRTILVDACIGEHKDRPEIPAWNRRSGTGWLDRLRAVGVAPEAIDTCSARICTSTMSAGTPSAATAGGARPSPTPATSSAAWRWTTGRSASPRARPSRCTSAACATASCRWSRRGWRI